jgi:hypothetical protein
MDNFNELKVLFFVVAVVVAIRIAIQGIDSH